MTLSWLCIRCYFGCRSFVGKIGHIERYLKREAKGVILSIKGSDDVGVAIGDGIEGLRAIDQHILSLVVLSFFSLAFGGRRSDGEAGTAHIG